MLLFHVSVKSWIAEIRLFTVVTLEIALARVILGPSATSCLARVLLLLAFIALFPLRLACGRRLLLLSGLRVVGLRVDLILSDWHLIQTLPLTIQRLHVVPLTPHHHLGKVGAHIWVVLLVAWYLLDLFLRLFVVMCH